MENTMSSLFILLLLAVVLVSSSSQASEPSPADFDECLIKTTQAMFFPIPRNLIYAPGSSNFSSVLNFYVRNLRYATPATPKPRLIVTPTSPIHVRAVVQCAKRTSFQIRVRSGGHDYDGLSYVSQVPFVILDLSLFRDIHIDLQSETATVGVGATTGELYYKIIQASKVHAFPSGSCTTLGLGGHFTGGGYGALARKYGLAIDNIVDATIVDVQGRILDRKAMGEDLFWAIRGGGASSFGVVINWKIKLVRVPETLSLFVVDKTLEQGGTDAVDKWQKLAAEDSLDRDLFVRLTFAPANNGTGNPNVTNTVKITFTGGFLGDSKKLLAYVGKVFPEMGLKQEHIKETDYAHSTLFWAGSVGPINPSLEALLNRTPEFSVYFKQHSDFVKTPIPRSGLEAFWKKVLEQGPLTHVAFSPYGGKMREIGESDTPFPHRAGTLFMIQYVSFWKQVEQSDKFTQANNDIYKFFTPYVSSSPRATYLNYRDLDIGTNAGGNKQFGYMYFKKNFDRLIKIKTAVDPDNFFQFEQSIPTLK
uniref:FAD-binding PCMH-type domain-containing protein n=1 Tax=Kalanchoe fedtschenkoi TaxID=63787 RepID=A0A7N0TN83_KALFE